MKIPRSSSFLTRVDVPQRKQGQRGTPASPEQEFPRIDSQGLAEGFDIGHQVGGGIVSKCCVVIIAYIRDALSGPTLVRKTMR